jgi:antitoxin component YwqK of YwqJK toxin-antitoxin module
MYYASGTLGEEIPYRNGKRDGDGKSYFNASPSAVQYLHTFANGRLVSRKQYAPDGKFLSREDFTVRE